MRMADEIDKVETAQGRRTDIAREAGEVATREELGVSTQRVAEWREVRDAGEENVERVIRRSLEEGRSARKKEI